MAGSAVPIFHASTSRYAALTRFSTVCNTGVITGYRATLDRTALGMDFTAYIAACCATHTKVAQQAFERAVQTTPEVRECHNVTGTVEYLLRIETLDLRAPKLFHTEVLGTLEHVRSITSYIGLDSPKDERGN